MKRFFLFFALLCPLYSWAQISDTAVLRSYVNANIVPNGSRAINAAHLNAIFNGTLNVLSKFSLKTGNLQQVTSAGNSTSFLTRFTGNENAAGSGPGVELFTENSEGNIQAFNRSSSSFTPLNVRTSYLKLFGDFHIVDRVRQWPSGWRFFSVNNTLSLQSVPSAVTAFQISEANGGRVGVFANPEGFNERFRVGGDVGIDGMLYGSGSVNLRSENYDGDMYVGVSNLTNNSDGGSYLFASNRSGAIHMGVRPSMYTDVLRKTAYIQTVGVPLVLSASGNAFDNQVTLPENGILTIDKQVQIKGGSPAAGRVLTSDATGLGSWQTPGNQWPVSVFNQGDFAVQTGDVIVRADPTSVGRTMTLPSANWLPGRILVVMNMNTTNSINTNVNIYLPNNATVTAVPPSSNWLIYSDGTNWRRLTLSQ